MTQPERVEGWDPSALDEMAAARDERRRDTKADIAPIAALHFDPCCPFRHEPGHVCLRRDGRSVGVLGECGDCYEGAQFGAYVDMEALDNARRTHPAAYEPDVAYLLQQSLIDQAESHLLREADPREGDADYYGFGDPVAS